MTHATLPSGPVERSFPPIIQRGNLRLIHRVSRIWSRQIALYGAIRALDSNPTNTTSLLRWLAARRRLCRGIPSRNHALSFRLLEETGANFVSEVYSARHR